VESRSGREALRAGNKCQWDNLLVGTGAHPALSFRQAVADDAQAHPDAINRVAWALQTGL
jgi:hypothetical protein